VRPADFTAPGDGIHDCSAALNIGAGPPPVRYVVDARVREFVMVASVGLLSTLLHEASARRPAEVVIETDQPMRVQLPGGATDTIGEIVQGRAMSDELSDLLTTEQQVELALGEPVKFDLVIGPYLWHLVGETAKEVISVRARPSAEFLEPGDSVQIPIEPEGEEDEPGPEDMPRIRKGPSGPSEIDIDLNFDDEPRPSPGLRLAALKPVPADGKPAPMWPRQVGGRAIDARPPAREGRPRRIGGPPLTIAPTQQLPLHAVGSPIDAGEVLAALTPGTLALLRVPPRDDVDDPLAGLLAGIEGPQMVLTEGDAMADATRRLPELGAGGTIVMRIEDPSPWLGWLLRRVEEGQRVLVESAATSAEGARRVLLGTSAGARAEAWLDAVRVIQACVEDGRWLLL
jgi:hypothetical protein